MSAVLAAMGGLQRPGRSLVEPGRLLGPASLLRAQISSRATVLGADGVTWDEFGANALRYNGTAQRLLLEGQRTNSVRNPRAEGSPPTNWVLANAGGLTATFIGTGSTEGIAFATYEVTGTPSATTGSTISFETATGIPALEAEAWAATVFCGLDPGFANNMSGTSFSLRLLAATDHSGSVFTPTTAALSGQRVSVLRSLPAGTTFVQPRLRFSGLVGTPVSFRIRLGWPQCERAAFAGTPVLPPIGSPAASTRGADLAGASLAALGIGAAGACTVALSGLVPAIGADQLLLQLDDGTDANRYRVLLQAAGSFQAGRETAGAAATTPALAAVTAGAPFRLGLSINGAGRLAGSVNGGTAQAVTGGPTGGLATLRLANNAIGNQPAFLHLAHLRVLPFALGDAALRSLVASLPG